MKGVFVLGMHRSGTSAAARLVNLLGVPTCVEGDLLRMTDDNPRGYWESASMTAFNDRLLDALGCDWSCPVEVAPGWERDEALVALRAEAVDLFSTVFPTEQWVWKDPRNCVTFAFWASSLDVHPVVVLLNRNPLEIAESLRARDDLGALYSLALWERSLRACLASIAGLPTLVTDYDSLLSDPLGWSEGVRAFLAGAGVESGSLREEDARSFVEPALRHASFTADDLRAAPGISHPQLLLYDALEELRGAHDGLPEVPLPDETPTTEALLAVRRAARAGEHALRERYEELETYARDLGERFLELEEYARGLQQQHAALEEYARGLQQQHTTLEEYVRGLQARVGEK
jgi:hypothetical protein